MTAFDYIVVGSSSAGAVVAGRLSEDPAVTVLLIEAGASKRSMHVRIPAAFVVHTYHAACTARMGTESDGVVDPELRVHGVTGLRVADASVFPTIPHGNTHAPSLLVGEKAAELIRASL